MVAGQIIADLAGQVLTVDDPLALVDRQIQTVFAQHPQADVITTMPGDGTVLGAEFVLAAGDLSATPTPGGWPPRPGWFRCRVTLDAGPETCTGQGATADDYGACSTCPPRPAWCAGSARAR